MNFGSYKEGKRRWDWVAQSCLFLVERSHTDYSLASLHVITEGPHRSLHSINTRSFDSTISPGKLATNPRRNATALTYRKRRSIVLQYLNKPSCYSGCVGHIRASSSASWTRDLTNFLMRLSYRTAGTPAPQYKQLAPAPTTRVPLAFTIQA